jgi:hypothetical protein
MTLLLRPRNRRRRRAASRWRDVVGRRHPFVSHESVHGTGAGWLERAHLGPNVRRLRGLRPACFSDGPSERLKKYAIGRRYRYSVVSRKPLKDAGVTAGRHRCPPTPIGQIKSIRRPQNLPAVRKAPIWRPRWARAIASAGSAAYHSRVAPHIIRA